MPNKKQTTADSKPAAPVVTEPVVPEVAKNVVEEVVEPAPEIVELAASNESENQAPEETTDDETVDEPIVKSGFRKVKAGQFRGSYKDVQFDDDGICARISDATLESLHSDFPGIEIEEIA